MKRILLFSTVLFSVLMGAQELPNRYLEEIFSTTDITENVVFSTNIPTVRNTNLFGNFIANEVSYGERSVTLRMNIYEPVGDEFTNRPVIIFAFGGGFVNGNKEETRIRRLCETFAKRGFVTATMDYRLGMNINNPELSKRAVYRALQDGRSAVRYFRKNLDKHNIDPNQIYLSGHSAGAFLAYHNVYLDKESERPASTRNYFGRPDLGNLDEIGDNQFYANGSRVDGKANGVMGFAGAVGDLSYIENNQDIPGVYFHSTNDNTVPYATGTPFSLLNWIPGINLPLVYGSSVMSERANTVGAENEFFSYTNRGHNVHANGSSLYPDIAPSGAQFFVNQFLGPDATTIQGDASYCVSCDPITYTATNSNAYYYDWQITGGEFLDRDPFSNQVTIQWDTNATNRNLTVTPYSNYLARGTSYNLFAGPDSCSWELKPGLGTDIGAGSEEVYVIGTNERIYRWNNNNWSILSSGKARRIDVGEGGIPWIIGTDNRIYRYINNDWRRVRGSASDIGVSGPNTFVAGRNNIIYRRRSNGRWTGASGGRGIRVDVASNGDAWVVGTDNYVYIVRNDVFLPRRGDFKASDITVASDTNVVWALELGTGIPHKYIGNGIWEQFNKSLTTITATDNGVLWGLNAGTNIWRNDCFVEDGMLRVASSENLELKLYPNPVKNILHISKKSFNTSQVKMTLINFNGAKVYANTFNTLGGNAPMKIDVSKFHIGHYVLKIESEGQEPIYKRVVIN